MSFYAKFYARGTQNLICEAPLLSANLSIGLNATNQMTAEILQDFPKSELVEKNDGVVLYFNGQEIFEGFIQIIDKQQNEDIKLTAVGNLDTLYNEKPFPLAYYEDKPLLGALTELLMQAGWMLGDIGSLLDPNQLVTKNLVSERNLLAQVSSILSGVPGLYYREGEEVLGVRTIDIGTLAFPSDIKAFRKDAQSIFIEDDPNVHWIETLSFKDDVSQDVYGVRALGGQVKDSTGVDRVINLGDALSADINRLADPEFPIIEDLAEQNWLTLNYGRFGRVGGTVICTTDGGATLQLGDFTGGGVEQNVWLMLTFVPFPGVLDHFVIFFQNFNANVLGSNLTWVVQEISKSDFRTVLVDNLATGEIPLSSDMQNNFYKIIPDTYLELEQGKLYGLAIGFNFNPGPDLFFVNMLRKTIPIGTSTSYAFLVRRGTNKITEGNLWNGENFLTHLEVKTRAIDSVVAGIESETAARYAPPKSGANSTLAQTRAAGSALYNWSKAYLLDREPDIEEYSMSVLAPNTLPKAGETIFVDSRAQGQYIDPYSGQITFTQRNIKETLRVDKAQITYDGLSSKVNYNLLKGFGMLRSSMIVDLYSETKSQEPAQGTVAARPWALLLDTLTTTISAVSPNTTMSDGTLAYQVSMSIFSGAYPSRPTNTLDVYLAGLPYGEITTGGQLRIEMVQLPSLATPEVIFKIALKTRSWEFGDSADLVVKLVWR